ncbi:hypothetical protein RhiirA5_432963 [Rhizophagus irregularis]|uniref:Uncharacterized protein n=1 Tax=Rhizophagus irregularis TaxID=588596 RepID=A0A2N0NSK2_9GLOM|nr:hypothetical protein RhiirA5_432963 [Rhizophagus irregularis]
MDNSPDTSKKHGHDLDIIDTTRKTKRAKDNNTDYYMVPTEFLEKLNSQNKMLRKMRREDALTPAFFEKGIVAITKEIQKTSLYPTQELFKERLEEYVEKRSNGYINDIGKHNWDSRFYSQFMPMCLEKMRHRRGSLSKEIKSALFKVLKIPEIKSNAGSKIGEWKNSPCVIEAYSNIWDSDDSSLVNINKIITKAMPKESKKSCLAPSLISFTLAVCCVVLNPHTDEIKCSEKSVKKRYVVFLSLLNDNKIPEESNIMHIQKEESKMKDNESIEDHDSEEETDDRNFFD